MPINILEEKKSRPSTGYACRLALAFIAICQCAAAQVQGPVIAPIGTEGSASAVWIFANLSFTGMRAQAKGTTFWKVVTFIFGFPGTLLTLLVVARGSERAYGIDMPRKQRT